LASQIYWVEPPAKLAEALEQYGQKAVAAVTAVAEYLAGKMQGEARQNAPWEDRTGNARTGLFATVEREAAETLVTIYLSHGHTIYYGRFLELCNGGRYAIIQPTVEANLPVLKRMLDEVFE